MIDYFSASNFDALRVGLESLKIAYMYLRADHDLRPWWTNINDESYILEKEYALDKNKEIQELEYPEFILLGINNSTSQMSFDALDEVETIFAKDNPIIIVSHVPYESQISAGLSNESSKVWQDRALLWGEGGVYQPNEVTQELLDLIYAPDSPVVAVIGGHLHFPYTEMMNESIVEYVFDASYKGSVGYITVCGDN